MGPQGAVEIVYRKELNSADDPVAKRAELVDEYTERFCNPYVAAERGFVDDVIDPADTRRKLVAGLELLRSKREELPKRKHGNVPLWNPPRRGGGCDRGGHRAVVAARGGEAGRGTPAPVALRRSVVDEADPRAPRSSVVSAGTRAAS